MDRRLVVKAGDKLVDCDPRLPRDGEVVAVGEATGYLTVKWNTGVKTAVSLARVHMNEGRRSGYRLLPVETVSSKKVG